jgi:hypothetical protein
MALSEEVAMSLISSSVVATSKVRVVCLSPGLAPLVNAWRKLKQQIFDSYRPELHYMRGPGPKWREKHAHATSVLSVSRVR